MALLSGCMSVVKYHPAADIGSLSPIEARRLAINQLKTARIETAGFAFATLKGGFKYDLRDKALVLNYVRYRNILDDAGAPVETVCGLDYLDDLPVTEYSNSLWQWAVALGPQCDNIGLYFWSKESALDFARAMNALKRRSETLSASGGVSAEDLVTAVQAAVAGRPTPPAAPAFTSDVDNPSYPGAVERPHDLAVIIGIGKYSDIPEAQFAERDAEAVKRHLLALGFPSRNVVHLSGEKAGYKAIEKFVETWLPRNADADSRVFFYFSGHGAPDSVSGRSYLLPYDGDPNFLENTGYPVPRLYEKLSALKAKEVFVVMDACFSGAGGRSVLAKGARPLVMKADTTAVPPNLTVFAAAAGEQITSTLDDQGHGTFTYFFLKGLGGAAKDGSGAVTARSLHDYLKPKVQDAARRQNRDQEPVLHGQGDQELVRF